MKPRFIQENCVEGNKIDPRQANVVARHRPDIILFELPARERNPSLIFNRYGPLKKPFKKIERIKHSLRVAARRYPYALSDILVWENIERLWRDGHYVLLFNIDGPDELRRDYFKLSEGRSYDQQRKRPIFWVHCYLREIEMADHIRSLLKNYREKPDPVIAVFLQSVHWHHVKFLLKNPSREKIWNYYYGRFPKIDRENISAKIKNESSVHYKYWKKTSQF